MACESGDGGLFGKNRVFLVKYKQLYRYLRKNLLNVVIKHKIFIVFNINLIKIAKIDR